jgi:hypothetical protein
MPPSWAQTRRRLPSANAETSSSPARSWLACEQERPPFALARGPLARGGPSWLPTAPGQRLCNEVVADGIEAISAAACGIEVAGGRGVGERVRDSRRKRIACLFEQPFEVRGGDCVFSLLVRSSFCKVIGRRRPPFRSRSAELSHRAVFGYRRPPDPVGLGMASGYQASGRQRGAEQVQATRPGTTEFPDVNPLAAAA